MQKRRYISTYYTALLLLTGFAFVFFILPKTSISTLENRVLSEVPQPSLASLHNGTFTAKIDSYIEDHFPFREAFVHINALLDAMLNRTEKNDVLIGKNAYLFEIGQDSDSNIRFNMDSIDAFAEGKPAYLLIVPNSSRVYGENLPDGYTMPQTYQKLMDYPLEHIQTIPILSTLLANKSDNLYYKSDHHWTADGAYRGYEAFMKSTQQETMQQMKQSVPHFLGSYYAKTMSIKSSPETFTYWVNPQAAYYINDVPNEWVDTKKLFENDKYAALLHGNPAHANVKGTGNKTLLILKDSFANAMIPLLAAHYAKIEIVDLRYYTEDLNSLLEKTQPDEILLLYGERSISKERSIGFALSKQEVQ